MLERIRERMGGAGLLVAVIALVLAVAGGAYAAGGGLSAKQKKEVEKIAKKNAGKPGAQGPAGVNGKDGVPGAIGAPGSSGKDGKNGNSVTVTKLDAGAQFECEETGGALVEEEGEPISAAEVCNGKDGAAGSPWTVGGLLPVGATETGAWTFVAGESEPLEVRVALSFPIKLAAPAPDSSRVHYETDSNFTDFDEAGLGTIGCEGAVQNPLAPSGHLCVYGNNNLTNAKYVSVRNFQGAATGGNRTGALVVFEREPTGIASGGGSFAVTG